MSQVDLKGSRLRTADNVGAVFAGASDWLQASVESRLGYAFACLTAIYVMVVVGISSLKLLWLDELITLHIARLGSFGAIWNALAQGADPNPPVMHVLVHYSRMLLGDHELAYRLPAVAGYWLGLFSLFLYLRRCLPGTWALAGTVLSMTMAAFDYSIESRSYAVFYGLAMFAMLCWSFTTDTKAGGTLRRLSFAGMIFALAVGVSTNYFAVLAFFPIAAGEVARTLYKWRGVRRQSSNVPHTQVSVRRLVDFRIWVGLLAAGATILIYRPMISHAIAQFSPYAWNKVTIDEVFDSYTEMVEVVLYPILALFFLALVLFVISRQLAPLGAGFRAAVSRRSIGSVLFPDPSRILVPIHEVIAIFTFMMYPILGYIVASIRGGMLSPRFVIPVCFGFAMAATLVTFYLFGKLRHAGIIMLCFCSAWFVAREAVVAVMYYEQKQAFFNIIDDLSQAEAAVPANAPIVIPDPLLALTFQHYAPPFLANRLVFPVDFPAIRAYRHDDSPEENLWAGRSVLYTMPIIPLATFQQSVNRYLVVATDANWMIRDLTAHRYPVFRLPIDIDDSDIGGFTPLAHGKPAFFTSTGDAGRDELSLAKLSPVRFDPAENLPSSRLVIPADPEKK